MSFCAAMRSSASAPPISGENSEQIGTTANTAPTQPSSPSALRTLVSEGTQKPGAMPWKNESAQSRANTPLASTRFTTRHT